MKCVSMCHSILERLNYLIDDWYYQWEPKMFWQINQKAIILNIPTERKQSGRELVLVYCLLLLDDGLQSASVLVELNDIQNQTYLQVDRIHNKLKNYQLLICRSQKGTFLSFVSHQILKKLDRRVVSVEN